MEPARSARVVGLARARSLSQTDAVSRSPLLLLLVALLSSGTLQACSSERDPNAPPDIVLILVDTLRRDHVSAYGADIETPNLQALADSGQVFSNLQASYHQTTMSMGALFTGHTPSIESGEVGKPLGWEGRHWCGMVRFSAGDEDSCIPRGLTTLAESLREAGYWTAGVVANRLLFAPAGYEQGFVSWTEVGAERADLPQQVLIAARRAQRVNRALEPVLEDRPTAPAFVYVHFVDVHDYFDRGVSYREGVEEFDAQFGETLDILDRAGLRDDAVIFVLSDHGENLGELHGVRKAHNHFGNPSYQPLLEIPLIVTPPLFDAPERLLRSREVAGLIRQAAGLSGDLVDEAGLLEEDEIFLSERKYLTYRRGRFKTSFHRNKMGKWMLWDLESDPGETENRIQDEREIAAAHLSRVQELVEQLAAEGRGDGELSEEDASRLRALGYLQ